LDLPDTQMGEIDEAPVTYSLGEVNLPAEVVDKEAVADLADFKKPASSAPQVELRPETNEFGLPFKIERVVIDTQLVGAPQALAETVTDSNITKDRELGTDNYDELARTAVEPKVDDVSATGEPVYVVRKSAPVAVEVASQIAKGAAAVARESFRPVVKLAERVLGIEIAPVSSPEPVSAEQVSRIVDLSPAGRERAERMAGSENFSGIERMGARRGVSNQPRSLARALAEDEQLEAVNLERDPISGITLRRFKAVA